MSVYFYISSVCNNLTHYRCIVNVAEGMHDLFQTKTEEEEIDRTPWGELEPSDEESSEEEEEEESDEDKPDETGFITPADRWGEQSLPLKCSVTGGFLFTPELVSLFEVASSLLEGSRQCRLEWRPLNSLS